MGARENLAKTIYFLDKQSGSRKLQIYPIALKVLKWKFSRRHDKRIMVIDKFCFELGTLTFQDVVEGLHVNTFSW